MIKALISFVLLTTMAFSNPCYAGFITRPFSGTYSWETPQGSGIFGINGYLDINEGVGETDFFIDGKTLDGHLTFHIFQSIPETGERNAWIGPWFENYSGYGQQLNNIPYLIPGLDDLAFAQNQPFSYDTLQFLSLWDSNSRPTGNARIVMQVDPSPVPEPSTILLVGSGLLGLARLRKATKRMAKW